MGKNIYIEAIGGVTSGSILFSNCTSQDANYGVYINYAENVTFDTCWFENLGVAITVKGSSSDPINMSSKVQVLNSRFANAAGFGAQSAPNNIKNGQVIFVENSFVNAFNNYSVAGSPENVDPSSSFLWANNNLRGGVNLVSNNFSHKNLSRTYGMVQAVSGVSGTATFYGHKSLELTSSATIKIFDSTLNDGELVVIKAAGTLTFDITGNLELASKNTLTINQGEVATFQKIDRNFSTSSDKYQLYLW